MTPRWLSVPFLLFIGGGFLAVAYYGYKTGKVPFGHSWRGLFLPTREDNPGAFYLALVAYVCFGMFLCIQGLRELLGLASPIPWQ